VSTLTAEALADLVRPGDTIAWSGSASEPPTLLELFEAALPRMPRATVLLGLGVGQHPDGAALAAAMHVKALGGAGSNRRIPGLDVLPAHYSALPDLVRRGEVRVDVALVQLAPDVHGDGARITLMHDYIADAVETARVVVAEVNEQAPCTAGEPPVDPARLHHVIHASRPLPQWQAPPPGAAAGAIGEQVARLVPDGATLEVGLGTLPDAVLAALAGKRDLGIHSGVIGDGVVALQEAGVISNRRKTLDAGITVTAALLGTDRLYRWAHDNPAVQLRSSRYTHDIEVLSQHDALYGINGAIEVDLTGQINAEVAGGRSVGLIGGACDFMRGALRSRGGRGIVVMESTARRGTVSRIVPALSAGVVTTPRGDADVVVTEFGTAHLRGRSVSERARALIAIAHPDFRDGLQAAAEHLV
jgi:acetyl-CoA hydrolase